MKKHYKALGLEEGVSKAEIENKYKELSKEYDPKNNDNQEFFKEEYEKIQEAYRALITSNILKNPVGNPKIKPANSVSSVSEEKLEESDDAPIIPSINPLRKKINIMKISINILIIIFIVVSLVCLLTLDLDRQYLIRNSNLSERISIWRTLVYSIMCITISALFSLVYFNKK